MCTYFTKYEDECSHAMKQAVQDAFEKKFDNYNQMKLIAHSFINRTEYSVQECVYMFYRSVAKGNISGSCCCNSKVPEKQFIVCLRENEILDSLENWIFKCNMVGCYTDRPNADYENRKYEVLDSMCCAEFLRYYSLVKRNHNLDNDDQPE